MGLDGKSEMQGHRIGEHISPQVRESRKVGGQMVVKSRHKLGEWRGKFAEKSKDLGHMALQKIAPLPSEEFEGYMSHLAAGFDPNIPFNPQRMQALIDTYGERNGAETGRFRILSDDGAEELSFHVSREEDGAFRVTCEGALPYKG